MAKQNDMDTDWAIPAGEEDQVGFPPYWQPSDKNKKLAAEVIGRDDEGRFVRYVLRATKPLKGCQGNKENKTEVPIKPGEYFTMSEYAGLPLEKYIGVGEIVCFIKGERDTPNGMMYVWGVIPSTTARKVLASKGSAAPALNRAPQETTGTKTTEIPF
jgi:hypothetical protein